MYFSQQFSNLRERRNFIVDSTWEADENFIETDGHESTSVKNSETFGDSRLQAIIITAMGYNVLDFYVRETLKTSAKHVYNNVVITSYSMNCRIQFFKMQVTLANKYYYK